MNQLPITDGKCYEIFYTHPEKQHDYFLNEATAREFFALPLPTLDGVYTAALHRVTVVRGVVTRRHRLDLKWTPVPKREEYEYHGQGHA